LPLAGRSGHRSRQARLTGPSRKSAPASPPEAVRARAFPSHAPQWARFEWRGAFSGEAPVVTRRHDHDRRGARVIPSHVGQGACTHGGCRYISDRAVIEIQELTKYYGARRAVGPLSFRIEKGEVVGLLGLNGAGKTTTLRMLSSDLLPTAGRMLVDGIDLAEAPEKVQPKIGYLPDR